MMGLAPAGNAFLTDLPAAAAKTRKAAARQLKLARSGQDGFLRRQAVRPATQTKYAAIVAAFYLKYVLDAGHCDAIVDQSLEKELTLLYLRGEEVSHARLLYYAVKWDRGHQHTSMPTSFAALGGFRKATCEVAGDANVLESIVLAAAAGCRTGASHNIIVAAASILQFDTVTRPSEILRATGAWLMEHKRGPWMKKVTLTIFPSDAGEIEFDPDARETDKTGQQDDTLVVGEVLGQWVAKLAKDLKNLCGNGVLLPISLPQFEAAFSESARLAGLERLRMTPHGNRHGGASVMGVNGADSLAIQSRGRWLSTRSVLRYQKKGRYMRLRARLSRAELQKSDADLTFLRAILGATCCQGAGGTAFETAQVLNYRVHPPRPPSAPFFGVGVFAAQRSSGCGWCGLVE